MILVSHRRPEDCNEVFSNCRLQGPTIGLDHMLHDIIQRLHDVV